jgi:7-carboxy-7-deazaguanine synthase
MSKIKISENFFSLQAEGRYVGVPSVFLRTFGCNFRCKQFGLSAPVTGRHNPEVLPIIQNISNYSSFDQLPLVSTGCDTYASIYPEFQHLSPSFTVEQLNEQFEKLLPNASWRQPNGNDVHLVITGGEPLLPGWQRVLPELLVDQQSRGLCNVTFETNGTQKILPELREFIEQDAHFMDFTFSVSPKLSASGEAWADAIRPEVVAEYNQLGFTYLKFVVDRAAHFDEADRAVAEYRAAGFTGVAYVMPVGGVVSVYEGNVLNIADEALRRGYYYSPRLHVSIWGNQWGK